MAAATRIAELVPIRYGRMVSSPFTFYRGAALIMASDRATTPRSGLKTQLCGDAHLSNFGIFQAPDRTLVFGINDFDETPPGPWEWDVKRLAASLEVATRERGLESTIRRDLVMEVVRSYREGGPARGASHAAAGPLALSADGGPDERGHPERRRRPHPRVAAVSGTTPSASAVTPQAASTDTATEGPPRPPPRPHRRLPLPRGPDGGAPAIALTLPAPQ